MGGGEVITDNNVFSFKGLKLMEFAFLNIYDPIGRFTKEVTSQILALVVSVERENFSNGYIQEDFEAYLVNRRVWAEADMREKVIR